MAVLCTLVTACGSSGGPGPLVLSEGRDSITSCIPGSRGDGLLTWDAPVGYAEDMYWNKSPRALTVESVKLIDPHNLVLHGSVLDKMAHASHALPIDWARDQIGHEDPAAWRARQPVPGAVMPPAGGPVDVNGSLSGKIDLWEIVVDVSAASPAGGWALGEMVRYQSGGQAWTLEAGTGLGLGTSLGPVQHSCDAPMKAIAAAFAAGK